VWLWHFIGVGQPAADLGPGVEALLVEDVGDVGLDGALGQEQAGCDLPVAEVVREELGDVEFSAGEHGARLGLDRWRRRALEPLGSGSERDPFGDRQRATLGGGGVERTVWAR